MIRTSACRRTGILLAVLLALAVPAAASAAAPGTPDAGFAGDGVASLTFPGDLAVGAAVLPDGTNLAVIGNTRMDYQHTITAVSYIARMFDKILNETEKQ